MKPCQIAVVSLVLHYLQESDEASPPGDNAPTQQFIFWDSHIFPLLQRHCLLGVRTDSRIPPMSSRTQLELLHLHLLVTSQNSSRKGDGRMIRKLPVRSRQCAEVVTETSSRPQAETDVGVRPF